MRVWRVIEGHLRAIWGPVWDSAWEGHSEVNLRSILSQLWTLSEKPHHILKISFIWPWVGPYLRNRLNMGPWDGLGWVPV